MHISESKRFYNVTPSVHYFYVKTQMLADFQICISAPLSLFHVKITSLNKYLDDLHNALKVIKLQIQVIGKCEHKIKNGSCLNCSPPGYPFEFEATTSIHGSVGFFINDNSCYKVRNDLRMILCGVLRSCFY